MSTLSRVTHRTLQESTLAALQNNLSALATLNQQISSGKRITKPSDDPTGTANVLQLKAEQANNTQYGQNADDGVAWLSTQDTALSTTMSQLQRARFLTVQALNATSQNPGSQAAIGAEMDGISSAVLGVANAQYLGRSVFAGTATGQSFAKTSTGDYSTASIAGTSVTRQIGPADSVRVDTDGASVFGADLDANGAPTGTTSVFKLLDKMSAAIKNPSGFPAGTLAGLLTQLDSRMATITTAQTDVGARENRVKDAQDAVIDRGVDLSTRLSSVEDTDMGAAAIQLQMQQTAYNAALAVTARTSQTSLLDFLK